MHHQGPRGGETAGPSPVDRGKQGTKRSLAVEAGGIPMDVVVAPANLRDDGLSAATLDALAPLALLHGQRHPGPTMHLDAGYDWRPCHEELARRGLASQIAPRGIPAPIQVGRRWVVERSHAWRNGFGKLRWCTERRRACVEFWLALACVVVIIRRLIRRAWVHYRWERRPRRPPCPARRPRLPRPLLPPSMYP